MVKTDVWIRGTQLKCCLTCWVSLTLRKPAVWVGCLAVLQRSRDTRGGIPHHLWCGAQMSGVPRASSSSHWIHSLILLKVPVQQDTTLFGGFYPMRNSGFSSSHSYIVIAPNSLWILVRALEVLLTWSRTGVLSSVYPSFTHWHWDIFSTPQYIGWALIDNQWVIWPEWCYRKPHEAVIMLCLYCYWGVGHYQL